MNPGQVPEGYVQFVEVDAGGLPIWGWPSERRPPQSAPGLGPGRVLQEVGLLGPATVDGYQDRVVAHRVRDHARGPAARTSRWPRGCEGRAPGQANRGTEAMMRDIRWSEHPLYADVVKRVPPELHPTLARAVDLRAADAWLHEGTMPAYSTATAIASAASRARRFCARPAADTCGVG